MGLAIARGLLNAIGGRVWAENVPGGGRAVLDGGSRRDVAGRARGLSMPPRILVVDDEPNILGTLAPLLRDARLRSLHGDEWTRGDRNASIARSRT